MFTQDTVAYVLIKQKSERYNVFSLSTGLPKVRRLTLLVNYKVGRPATHKEG